MRCLTCALALVAACGSRPGADTAMSGGPAKAVLPDVPFDQLDHAQRIEFMEQEVMPAMKPMFQGHDARRFAKLQCETCHGRGAPAGTFEMPNPDLPKLTRDMKKFDKRDIDWMTNEVAPTMAKLLGRPVRSADAPMGLDCLSCHTLDHG